MTSQNINFRFHDVSGDTVGVRLDMERGTLSFFLDGMKYGEHVVTDLGTAFENLAGNSHGSKVKPRTFFPVFGFRKNSDRITITGKWLSSPGTHPASILGRATAVASLLCSWEKSLKDAMDKDQRRGDVGFVGHATEEGIPAVAEVEFASRGASVDAKGKVCTDLPQWLYREAWQLWTRWQSGRWRRITTRAQSGLMVDVDCSPLACVKSSLLLGLRSPLFAGDRVRLSVCGSWPLEQKEVAVVLGVYQGHLFYHIE
ncbi:unnamed protein product, partial [Discosporangium mesarthrocarpum]